MSNAFSELIERATAGEGLNREEIHTLLVDGDGQDDVHERGVDVADVPGDGVGRRIVDAAAGGRGRGARSAARAAWSSSLLIRLTEFTELH